MSQYFDDLACAKSQSTDNNEVKKKDSTLRKLTFANERIKNLKLRTIRNGNMCIVILFKV